MRPVPLRFGRASTIGVSVAASVFAAAFLFARLGLDTRFAIQFACRQTECCYQNPLQSDRLPIGTPLMPVETHFAETDEPPTPKLPR